MTYSVYVAHSRQSIDDIERLLVDFLPAPETDFMFVRAMNTYDRERNQLRDNRLNLLFFDRALDEKTLSDMGEVLGSTIKPYNWQLFKDPSENENSNLHFRGFPRTMTKKDIVSHITNIVPHEIDIKVTVALLDRGSSMARGDGTIRFGDAVPIETRRVVKLLLDNTILPHGGDRHFVFCKWHRTSDMRLPSARLGGARIRRPASRRVAPLASATASAEAPSGTAAINELAASMSALESVTLDFAATDGC